MYSDQLTWVCVASPEGRSIWTTVFDVSATSSPSVLQRCVEVLASPIEGRVLLGPNWFASVMGTGIVAVAGATLPVGIPSVLTTVAWALAVLLLVSLLIFLPLNWAKNPQNMRAIANDAIAIQFFGAPPMALMTVASATLLVGQQYIGETVAVPVAWVLWGVGTVLGLITAVAVPYRLFTRLDVRHDGAFGGWLMPVVPPMVSAAVGALLIPYAAEGEVRETLLMLCYAFFGMSLMTSLIIITLIWSCGWCSARWGSPSPQLGRWGLRRWTPFRLRCPRHWTRSPWCSACPCGGSCCCGCRSPRR